MNITTIITKAVLRFEEETGFRLVTQIDADYADMVLRDMDLELHFTAEVIPLVNRNKLGEIKNRLNKHYNIPLLITTTVNNELAEYLKNLEINFIDTAGNAFIKVPPLYINIKGQKIGTAKKITEKDAGIFQAAGLQIIFALLCNPRLENNTYREIAEMANVALGTVHITMKQLEKNGFMINDKTYGKKLVNKEKLIKEWALGYPGKIKPKYFVGTYQTDKYEFINKENLVNFDALFGGETAAAMLTNYLRPLVHTIYIKDKLGEFILRNHLKKNPDGNIEIIKKFWNFKDDNETKKLAPVVLIYTDLITTGDPRNIETANIIFEREIVGHLN